MKKKATKTKSIRAGGFTIRTRTMKTGTQAYQVDFGYRNGKHERRQFKKLIDAKQAAKRRRTLIRLKDGLLCSRRKGNGQAGTENTKQPTLKPIPLQDFYPDDLAADLATFTAAVDALNTARKDQGEQAAALLQSDYSGTKDKTENYTIEAGKLTEKSINLDIQEARLIHQKKQFQAPIIKARKAERDRYVNMAKDRYSEVVQLQHLADGLAGFLRAVTVEDEERLEVINARIAAVDAIIYGRSDRALHEITVYKKKPGPIWIKALNTALGAFLHKYTHRG